MRYRPAAMEPGDQGQEVPEAGEPGESGDAPAGSLPHARIVARRSAGAVPPVPLRRVGWRLGLACAPLIVAAFALHALWGLKLDGVNNPGWGVAGAAMAALILFGGALASARLVGGATWKRVRWLGVVVVIPLVAVIAPARQHAHDDAAFHQAIESRALLEQYLVWGERHRPEADALIAQWNVDHDATELVNRRAEIEVARGRVASAPLDPAVSAFLDVVLAAAAGHELAKLAIVVSASGPSDPAVATTINDDLIFDRVSYALRAYAPVALVDLIRTRPGVATVEVRYQVRPWLIAGAPVTFGDATTVGLGLAPRHSYAAIELVIELRLVRADAPPVELRVLVHPPQQFDARSFALLSETHGEHAIYRAMADQLVTQIPAAIQAALAAGSAPRGSDAPAGL
jgi:hypothetical protein